MTELDDTPTATPPREFTGKHMLAIMVAFFGVIIAVNIGMATLASKTWTGLVVKNSYVASQDFNDHLEASRIQEKLGWQSTLSYENGALEFALMDKNDKPVNMDLVMVELGRPAFEQQDQKIELVKIGDGKYRGEVVLAPGPWAFSVRANKGDQPYRLDIRLDISAAAGAGAGK